jgi:hypothetical protein
MGRLLAREGSVVQRIAALAAAALSVALGLGGCHSKPTGPFKPVHGGWPYRHTLIRDVDVSTFQPLDKQDAKDAACAHHARSRRRQGLITAVSPAHGRICHWPSIPFTSNIRLGKSMLKLIVRQKPWSFGSAS